MLIISACAQTNEAKSDGQTHWMTRCDDSSDCGELSCICGVCTEACTASDECSIADGVAASCEATRTVLDAAACSGLAGLATVCVPQCDGQSACDDIASDLTCSSAGVCAVEGSAQPLVDGSVDGSAPDASEPDASEPAPVALTFACDDEGNLEGEGSFEVVASGAEVEDELAVAPDGTIYLTGVHDSVRGSLLRITDGEFESFGAEVWEVQIMQIAGPDVVVAMANGSEVTIASIDLATEQRLNLAYEPAHNAKGLAADDEAIYWIGESQQDPTHTQLWRSPRVPGASEVLFELDGPMDHLVLANDQLYFLAAPDGELALYNVTKAGDDVDPIRIIVVPEFAGGLYSDGQSLFLPQITGTDPLGNAIGDELGIVRVDPRTAESEWVFETDDAPRSFALGEQHMYWVTDRRRDPFEPDNTLWRARKDGAGAPQALAAIEAFAGPFVEHDGALYFQATCRVGNDGQIKTHIVELPAPTTTD